MKKTIWNRLIIDFFNGIVILLPLTVTVIFMRFLVMKVNNAVLTPLLKLLSLTGAQINRTYIAKSIIFIAVIALVILIGWAAKILFVNRLFTFGESFLVRVPILGRVYNAVKQISSSFLGQGKTIFKNVVVVEYPRKGLYSLGFTTGPVRGSLKNALDAPHVSVFVPTTPNPTSGLFIVVPENELKVINMSVENAMKLVVSAGAFSPDLG